MLVLKKILFIALFVVIPFTLQSSCGDSGEEAPDAGSDEDVPLPPDIPNKAPIPAPTSLDCPKGTSLTYGNFGEGFFLTYCNTCHSSYLEEGSRAGAPTDTDLDQVSDILLWRTSVMSKVVTDGTMPPSRHIDEDTIVQLKEWLNCGAPTSSERLE